MRAAVPAAGHGPAAVPAAGRGGPPQDSGRPDREKEDTACRFFREKKSRR